MSRFIQSIRTRTDGGFDVIYDEDESVRLACQVYDRDGPQHFTWAEVQAALPEKLNAELPPPPDPRTPEQRKDDEVRAVQQELAVLDNEISRVEEDLVDKIGLVLADSKKAARARKEELRVRLRELEQ